MHPLITETVIADITAERRSIAARARRAAARKARRLSLRRAGHLALHRPAVRPS